MITMTYNATMTTMNNEYYEYNATMSTMNNDKNDMHNDENEKQ